MDTAAHHRQSPIDITRDEVTFGADLPGLSVRYPNRPVTARVCLEVKDGDPTPAGAEVVPEVVVHVAGSGAAVVLGGAEYRLDSLHWHTPSEHWIDGRPAPLEVHLVHRSEAGVFLVIGVLSLVGEHDETIAPAFDLIDRFDPGRLTPDEPQCFDAEVRLDRLLPKASATFRYDGSLTTAPFTEGVTWIVFTEPLAASADQIDRHMALVSTPTPRCGDRPNPPGNARPIQERGRRPIATDLPG